MFGTRAAHMTSLVLLLVVLTTPLLNAAGSGGTTITVTHVEHITVNDSYGNPLFP